jgi:hypothetical protein
MKRARVPLAMLAMFYSTVISWADGPAGVQLPAPQASTQTAPAQNTSAKDNAKDSEKAERSRWTEAAIIAAVVAASIASYKAKGKPCACPSDTDRAGRSCGARSAYSRPGGFKPLCNPFDVTLSMISAFRATGAIPPIE